MKRAKQMASSSAGGASVVTLQFSLEIALSADGTIGVSRVPIGSLGGPSKSGGADMKPLTRAGTVSTPCGGHGDQALRTSSIEDSVLCSFHRPISKKIQKKAAKNMISEAMNRIMP